MAMVELKQVQPGMLDPTKPVAVPVIKENPDGSVEGKIYIAIGGVPQGHLEIFAGGLEPLKHLVNGLLGYLQSRERQILIPKGSVPATAIPPAHAISRR